jgi:GTP-binding protein
VPVLIVASKRDKVNQSELSKNKKLIQEKFDLPTPPITVSAVSKFGLDSLWFELLNVIKE